MSDRSNAVCGVARPRYGVRVPRLIDDADINCCSALPRYGGWPSPLADEGTLLLAKWMLLEGKRVTEVARELDYNKHSAFSDAFLRFTGERPSAWQTRHGVTARRVVYGRRSLRAIPPPDHTGQTPLPLYGTPAARKRDARRAKAAAKAQSQ